MPEGAISHDLDNDLAFSDYLEANVWKWYEFVHRVRGKSIRNGQIRLVVGCDKTTAWGIATVSGMSQEAVTKLEFKTLEAASSSTTPYTWECSGMVEVRVGPDKYEIEALRNCDDGDPLDTTLRNQCLFVRTMNATLSNDDWAKLMQNLGKTTVEDPDTSSGTILDPPALGSRPSGSNTKSSDQLGSHQGAPGTSYSMSRESRVMISTIPNPSAVSICILSLDADKEIKYVHFQPYHPSDDLNQQLLLKVRIYTTLGWVASPIHRYHLSYSSPIAGWLLQRIRHGYPHSERQVYLVSLFA